MPRATSPSSARTGTIGRSDRKRPCLRSVRARPFKLDVAYLHNIAESRTGDVFGHRNKSVIFTLNFEYEALLKKH